MTQSIAPPAGRQQLFGPGMLQNPYPVYHFLRATSPVHWAEALNGWVLTRYADVAAMLRSPHVSSERSAPLQNIPDEFRELFTFRSTTMLNADAPRHTRLRLLVSKAFTPGAVEALAPSIRAFVEHALDAVQARGRMEVMGDLAYRLPVAVIATLLGVPQEDHARFKAWADDITLVIGNVVANLRPEDYRRSLKGMRELVAYLRDVAARRRVEPRDDLMTALVRAEEQGDRLTEDEVLSNAMLLLNAGHETTTNLIGNGTLALLQNPDQLRRLLDDPSLIPSAVEELLRYDSPVQFTTRVLRQDVTLGGTTMRAEQTVLLLLGAANRDPAQFDDPDRLDVARPDNKHVAFGLGSHFCLGAPLARLEGRIAFEVMLRRLPGMHLAAPEPEYRQNFNLRGLTALHVTF